MRPLTGSPSTSGSGPGRNGMLAGAGDATETKRAQARPLGALRGQCGQGCGGEALGGGEPTAGMRGPAWRRGRSVCVRARVRACACVCL